MEVDFNPGRNPVSGPSQPVARRESTSTTETTTMSFERTTALEQSLKEVPLVRPEKVARAADLIADPSYPSKSDLNRMANLFAQHLKR